MSVAGGHHPAVQPCSYCRSKLLFPIRQYKQFSSLSPWRARRPPLYRRQLHNPARRCDCPLFRPRMHSLAIGPERAGTAMQLLPNFAADTSHDTNQYRHWVARMPRKLSRATPERSIVQHCAIRSRATFGPEPSPTRSHVSSCRSLLLPVRPFTLHAGGIEDLDIQCLRRSALIAQGIEHRFPKPCVAGSNPAGGTLRE